METSGNVLISGSASSGKIEGSELPKSTIVTSSTKQFIPGRRDEKLFSLLTSKEPPAEVNRVTIGKEEAKKADILALVEKYNGDPRWLLYEVLFRLLEIDKEKATMGIPFLREDKFFNIPGLKKYRFNVGVEVPDKDRTIEQHLENIGRYARHIREKLPEVPLVVSDVTSGLPLRSDLLDVLVFNHGVILEELPVHNPLTGEQRKKRDGSLAKNTYIFDIPRVVRPGGLVIVLQYKTLDGPQLKADNVAALINAEVVSFNLPKEIMGALEEKTGKKGIKKFEDFFTIPGYEDMSYNFLRMPKRGERKRMK